MLLVSMRPRLLGWNELYLSHKQTATINGFFMIWVFIRHVQLPYINESGYDYAALALPQLAN